MKIYSWEQVPLENIIKVNSGRDYKLANPGDIPVYGTGGYMLSIDTKLSDEDAVGIGRKGTINKPFFLKAPFWTVDTLFYLTSRNQNNIHFLLPLFQKINWKRYDESTGVPSLSKSTINKIRVNIPKIEEQRNVALLFQSLDHTITLHEEKQKQLKQLKKALLQKLFADKTGYPKIRFRGFDKPWNQQKFGNILTTHSFRQYLATPSNNGRYKVIQQGDDPVIGYADGVPFKDYKLKLPTYKSGLVP